MRDFPGANSGEFAHTLRHMQRERESEWLREREKERECVGEGGMERE